MSDKIRVKPFVLVALSVLAVCAEAGDWPQFRGPHGNGYAVGETFPSVWGLDKNIKWKISLPEPGVEISLNPLISRNSLMLCKGVFAVR